MIFVLVTLDDGSAYRLPHVDWEKVKEIARRRTPFTLEGEDVCGVQYVIKTDRIQDAYLSTPEGRAAMAAFNKVMDKEEDANRGFDI